MIQQRNLRTFYALVLTQTFSIIGSRLSSLVVGMWIFTQTGEATPLALVTFFTTLPMLITSNLAGILADRYDRRYVMVIADIGQAVGTILLLMSFATRFQIWHLYVVTFVQSLFGVFQGPAFTSTVTTLIPDDQRDRANALQQMSGPFAGIIAPVLAGFVYIVFGVIGAILIDLFTFLVATVVVIKVHIPRVVETAEGHATRKSVWAEALGGLRYLLKRRSMLWMSLHVSLANFLVGGAMALITPYLLLRTGSAETLGMILGVLYLGALAGGLVMGVWGGTRPRIHTIMPGIALMGGFMALFGTGQSPLVLGATLFCMFFPSAMVNASFRSILQVKVPPDLQGRVFAVQTQLSILLMPAAALLVGPLADQVVEPLVNQPGWELVAPLVGTTPGSGMGLIFFTAGLITSFITFVIYAIPQIRDIETILPDYKTHPTTIETESAPLIA